MLIDPNDRELFVELLVPCATTIERGAHLLFTMAKTYYAVSSEYMINQIAGVGKMLTLQTDEARSAHLKEISNQSVANSFKITEMVQERRAIYIERTKSRQAEYAAYIASLAAYQLEETTA